MDVRVLDDPPAVADAVAATIARRLRAAARARGRASLAVSGGGTPTPMFDVLAGLDVPWDVVDVFQVDERVAPDGHPDRNATDLRTHLLDVVGSPARRVHLMPVTAARVGAAARRYAAAVEAVAPLDVVHLGVGDDGHTASWPPGSAVVDERATVAVVGPFNGRERMTLTPVAVNGARSRVVQVVGASKAGPIARWLASDRELPIARVRRTGTVLLLDRAAAGR